MRIIIDSEKIMDCRPIFNDMMMNWETTLIITIGYYIDNWLYREHEIKIRALGCSPDVIASKVMKIIEDRDWEGAVRINCSRREVTDKDMMITDVEIRDTAGVLAWLRDMKGQLKNLLTI
jgi:hypothetical protein